MIGSSLCPHECEGALDGEGEGKPCSLAAEPVSLRRGEGWRGASAAARTATSERMREVGCARSLRCGQRAGKVRARRRTQRSIQQRRSDARAHLHHGRRCKVLARNELDAEPAAQQCKITCDCCLIAASRGRTEPWSALAGPAMGCAPGRQGSISSPDAQCTAHHCRFFSSSIMP